MYIGACLDDLVIFSYVCTCTWAQHLKHVKAVSDKLYEARLIAKPRKCKFDVKCTCTLYMYIYLGHVVGGSEGSPDPSKLEAMQRFPIPSTEKQARAFRRLTRYYCRFIPVFDRLQ